MKKFIEKLKSIKVGTRLDLLDVICIFAWTLVLISFSILVGTCLYKCGVLTPVG